MYYNYYNPGMMGTNMYQGMNMANGINMASSMNSFNKAGLFTGLKNINWNGFLNNTSKTLNIINQAIPIVNQVKPLANNVRTMFKIANIMRDDNSNNISSTNIKNVNKEQSINQPTFFN